MLTLSASSRAIVARFGGRAYGLAHGLVRRSSARAIGKELSAPADPTGATTALVELLEHAAEHVPYWKARLDPRRDLRLQFAQLPPLTKDDIRLHADELKSQDLPRRRWWVNHSGGSSGSPIGVIQDREFADWSMATSKDYYRRQLSLVPDAVPKVLLWGSEGDLFGQTRPLAARLRNFLTQTIYLNSFRMDAAVMRGYVEVLEHIRPVFIRGYASSLFELASFAESESLAVHRPELIVSSAEMLRPEMRATIERVFRAPVFDFYGSREVGPLAGQGRDGVLHLFRFFNHVEIVDGDNRPVAPGEHGRVLVTTLRNRAMPLVRYEIGDTAQVAAVDPDGSAGTLSRVTGRVTDHFAALDGARVHGEYFTHLFYGVEAVRAFQVVQRRTQDVQILWVPRAGVAGLPAAVTDDIDVKIRLVLGPACAVEWTRVDELPGTPHGKHLFTYSLVRPTARR